MHCCDTGATIPAVRLEHLNVKAVTRLNDLIGRMKHAKLWNARIMLFLNGGNMDGMEPFKMLKLPEE